MSLVWKPAFGYTHFCCFCLFICCFFFVLFYFVFVFLSFFFANFCGRFVKNYQLRKYVWMEEIWKIAMVTSIKNQEKLRWKTKMNFTGIYMGKEKISSSAPHFYFYCYYYYYNYYYYYSLWWWWGTLTLPFTSYFGC